MKTTTIAALAALQLNAEQLTCYDSVTCSPPAIQQTYTKAIGTLCVRPGDPTCGTTIQPAYYGIQAADVRMYVVGYQIGNPAPIYLAQKIVRNTAATSLTFQLGRCDDYHTVVGHTVVTGTHIGSASVTVKANH